MSTETELERQSPPVPRRSWLRTALLFLAVGVLLVGGGLSYIINVPPSYPTPTFTLTVEATPQRLEHGKALVTMLCTQCHADSATGKLSGRLLTEAPTALVSSSYSANITTDSTFGIGNWTDGQLAYLLRTGVTPSGRLTAPWMMRWSHLADEDLYSIIAFLRSVDPLVRPSQAPSRPTTWTVLGKVLQRVAWAPHDYPTEPIAVPDAKDRLAVGKYLVQGVGQCYDCHSADFSKVNARHPEQSGGYLGGGTIMHDLAGAAIVTPNLTPDSVAGIGRWSEAEFVRALRDGQRPDGTAIRYPMGLYKELSIEDAAAVYAYLRTVPALATTRPTPTNVVRVDGDHAGKEAYQHYGCRSCHGDAGVGLGDLRQADRKYANDSELEAWIRHPEQVKPGTKMPTFDQTISAKDFPDLIGYVRQLGRRAGTGG